MTKRLMDERITEALSSLPDWTREGNAIGRMLVFADFREVISFLTLIAFDAEEADHHPDLTINYKRLNVSLTTHSEGGVTQKDIDLARLIDRRFARFSGGTS